MITKTKKFFSKPRNLLFFILFIISASLYGSFLFAQDSGLGTDAQPRTGQATPVTIRITRPTLGTVITDRVTFEAASTAGLLGVGFKMDTTQNATEPQYHFQAVSDSERTQWNYELDSTTIENGQYFLYASGLTENSHLVKSATVVLIIQNTQADDETQINEDNVQPDESNTTTQNGNELQDSEEESDRDSTSRDQTDQRDDVLNDEEDDEEDDLEDDGITEPDITVDDSELEIIRYTLIAPTQQVVSGRVEFVVQIDSELSGVVLQFRGPQEIDMSARRAEGRWRAVLDSSAFPNGRYVMTVSNVAQNPFIQKDERVFEFVNQQRQHNDLNPDSDDSSHGNTLVEHNENEDERDEIEEPRSVETRELPSGSATEILDEVREREVRFSLNMPQVFSGVVSVVLQANNDFDEVTFGVRGQDSQYGEQFLGTRRNSRVWFFEWDTTRVENGEYEIFALAHSVGGDSDASIRRTVKNEVAQNSVVPRRKQQVTPSRSEVETPNKARDYVLNEKCRNVRIVNRDMCEKYLTSNVVPRECYDNEIVTPQECELFLIQLHLPDECQEKKITTVFECDQLMRERYVESQCFEAGITDTIACNAYLLNRYATNATCAHYSKSDCENIIKDHHLGHAIRKEQQIESIDTLVTPHIGQSVVLQKIDSSEQYDGLKKNSIEDVVPIVVDENITVSVLRSEKAVHVNEQGEFVRSTVAVMTFDSDGDGLTDEMETRLGSNPNDIDSDGDGYLDGEEVENGYDPFGPGRLKKTIAPLERALVEKKSIEQPTVSGMISDTLRVQKVVTINTQHNKNVQKISGTAKARQIILLYIYSELPIVTTVATDQYGNWEYTLQKSLKDGRHDVYVTINDNTGKVVEKSSPFSFLIKEAQAISAQEIIGQVSSPQGATSFGVPHIYLLGIFFLIVCGILLFIYFMIKTRQSFQ